MRITGHDTSTPINISGIMEDTRSPELIFVKQNLHLNTLDKKLLSRIEFEKSSIRVFFNEKEREKCKNQLLKSLRN